MKSTRYARTLCTRSVHTALIHEDPPVADLPAEQCIAEFGPREAELQRLLSERDNPLLVNWIIGDHFGYLRDYEKKILGGPKAMEYCKAKFKRKESSIYSYCNLARYIPRDFLETLDRKVPQGAIMMIANQKAMPILPIRLLQLELVVGGCRGAALKRVIAAVQDL